MGGFIPIEDRVKSLEDLEACHFIDFKLHIAHAKRAIAAGKRNSARSHIGRTQTNALTREQDHECNLLLEQLKTIPGHTALAFTRK